MNQQIESSRLRLALSLILVCLPGGASIHARPVHSYVNELGVKIYFTVSEQHVDIDGIPTLQEATAPEPTKKLPEGTRSRYEGSIARYAAAHSVDPELVRAVISAESAFNPTAISPRGAIGLMQLIPSTARRFGVHNIFHPDQNIEGGVKYLRFLLDMFHEDLRLTLAAYNAGENIVRKVRGIPNYPETMAYVNRITARYGDTYRPRVPEAAPESVSADENTSRIYRTVDPSGNVIYTNRPVTP